MFRHSCISGAIAGLVGLACLPSAALARDGWYLGAGVGPNFKDSETFNGDNGSFSADYSDNAIYGVSLGYASPSGLRPEFAVDFRSNDVSSLSTNGTSSSNVTGHEDADAFMFNIWYDLRLSPEWHRLHPYVGGGVGFAQVGIHNMSTTDLSPYVTVDDTQTVLAYQLGVGASYDISPDWALLAEFRYLASDTADFKYTAPAPELNGTVNAGYSAESLMFGVRYQFGRNLFR